MEFIIEDGYNTFYICVLFVALFHSESMIERCFLIDNNLDNVNYVSNPKQCLSECDYSMLYFQKIIMYNFVKRLKNSLCISSRMINEIRLCALTLGWMSNSDKKTFNECDPIDFLVFLIKLLNIKVMNIMCPDKNIINDNELFITTHSIKDVQTTYNEWEIKNKLINFPIFVIFKIFLNVSPFSINKKIKLFKVGHNYSNVKWVFHSILYKNNNKYATILYKNDKLFMFSDYNCPCIRIVNENILHDLKNTNIYIIYRKEPVI